MCLPPQTRGILKVRGCFPTAALGGQEFSALQSPLFEVWGFRVGGSVEGVGKGEGRAYRGSSPSVGGGTSPLGGVGGVWGGVLSVVASLTLLWRLVGSQGWDSPSKPKTASPQGPNDEKH